MLAVGVLRGIFLGVGGVQSWQDVTWALMRLQKTRMAVISAAHPWRRERVGGGGGAAGGARSTRNLSASSAAASASSASAAAASDQLSPEERVKQQMQQMQQESDKSFWNFFIDSLFEDFLITKEEKKMLQTDVAFPPKNDEAKRRIVHFMWSLDHMNSIDSSDLSSFYRKSHRVRTMPSWTVIIPIYNEPIAYSADELRTRRRPDR